MNSVIESITIRTVLNSFDPSNRSFQMAYSYLVLGGTYKEIGEDFGVCGSRVRQCVEKFKRQFKYRYHKLTL